LGLKIKGLIQLLTTSKNPNNIIAVVPFFNEEKHLTFLIEQVLNFVDILILVDDGSIDNSLKQIPNDDKIVLIKHSRNFGKGAALKTGLLKSIELASYVTLTLDADLQHDPKYIPRLVESVKNYDFVIGARNKNHSSMPIHRKLSNWITSKLLSIKTGTKILDSQSGYRAFKTNILKDILPTFAGFEAESEMIVKLLRKNYKLDFITIPTIYGDDDSKMKAIPAILGFIKVILKT